MNTTKNYMYILAVVSKDLVYTMLNELSRMYGEYECRIYWEKELPTWAQTVTLKTMDLSIFLEEHLSFDAPACYALLRCRQFTHIMYYQEQKFVLKSV